MWHFNSSDKRISSLCSIAVQYTNSISLCAILNGYVEQRTVLRKEPIQIRLWKERRMASLRPARASCLWVDRVSLFLWTVRLWECGVFGAWCWFDLKMDDTPDNNVQKVRKLFNINLGTLVSVFIPVNSWLPWHLF